MDLITDFETVNTDGVDLRVVGAAVYAEHPATQILVVTFLSDFGYAWTWHPGDPTDELDELVANPDVTFVSHGDFERYIWQAQMVWKHGFLPLPIERWCDSMAEALYHGLPGGLDKVAPVLGLTPKDTEGSKLTVSLSKKIELLDDPAVIARVDQYNFSDCITEQELHQRVSHLSPYERRIWELDQRINQRGVKLDLPYIAACRDVLDRASVPMLAEFAEITGLRPTQRDKVLQWLGTQGVTLDSLKKDRLTALLGGGPDDGEDDGNDEMGDDGGDGGGGVVAGVQLPPHIRRALHIRQLLGSASVKKLKRMQQCACPDGRSRGLIQYAGAHTLRWAGRLWQPQNFVRRAVPFTHNPDHLVAAIHRGDLDELSAVYCDPFSAVMTGLRHAIIAEDGRTLPAGDFAGIEMRVDLALAGQHDKCELLASGKDVYVDMADDIYGLPKGTVTKKDVEKRTIGKHTVLGCGFEMGPDTFHDRYCPHMPLEFAQQVVSAYRRQWAPEVPKLWRGLEQAALRAVYDGLPYEHAGCTFVVERGWLTILLPGGSKLWYYNPQICKRRMPWDANDIRLGWTFEVMKNGHWQRCAAYGGLITENVVQHIARCLLCEAMLRLEAEGFPIILTIHDEILAEVPAPGDFRAFKEIMEVRSRWAAAMGIPIAVEGGIDRRYRKW